VKGRQYELTSAFSLSQVNGGGSLKLCQLLPSTISALKMKGMSESDLLYPRLEREIINAGNVSQGGA